MKKDTVHRRMEILLVEDNLKDARTTIEALRQERVPCRVTLVRDGEEAMQFLHREAIFARAPRPDLILLDMQLPKKDGCEVLAEIRADEDLRDVPVIVLTVSRVLRAVLEAQNLTVDAYMTKPVSLEQFVTAVRSIRRSWIAESVLLVQ